jgi:Fe-S-cluster containining protein
MDTVTGSCQQSGQARPARVFECRRCGACCLGRGGVRLDEKQAGEAAAWLRLSPADFTRRYLAPGPPPRDVLTGNDGFCLFHQADGRCRIHPVKPDVCRQWPFLPALLTRDRAFLEAGQACPGLAPDLTWAEFKAHRPADRL